MKDLESKVPLLTLWYINLLIKSNTQSLIYEFWFCFLKMNYFYFLIDLPLSTWIYKDLCREKEKELKSLLVKLLIDNRTGLYHIFRHLSQMCVLRVFQTNFREKLWLIFLPNIGLDRSLLRQYIFYCVEQKVRQ